MPRIKLRRVVQQSQFLARHSFGLWLQDRRTFRRFSLQKAADAVGVHKLTWLRWEQGRSKVPYSQLQPIAKALKASRRRTFYVAGYDVPRAKNDSKHVLDHIHELLLMGDLQLALEELLGLYWRMRPSQEPYLDALVPPNFASAIIFLDALPVWLFEVVLKCMQHRLERQKKEGVYIRFRNSLLNECLAKLKAQTPPIMDTCPEVTTVGSGLHFDREQKPAVDQESQSRCRSSQDNAGQILTKKAPR
jgi:transcriptional regulator with XRE-family HTH domain